MIIFDESQARPPPAVEMSLSVEAAMLLRAVTFSRFTSMQERTYVPPPRCPVLSAISECRTSGLLACANRPPPRGALLLSISDDAMSSWFEPFT